MINSIIVNTKINCVFIYLSSDKANTIMGNFWQFGKMFWKKGHLKAIAILENDITVIISTSVVKFMNNC